MPRRELGGQTRTELARSIRELADLMLAFHQHDPELERLCDRTHQRVIQLRTLIANEPQTNTPQPVA